MHISDFVTAAFALALTLGLIGLAAVALRRYGPDYISRLSMQKKDRRLKVVESLVLDPTRRVVLLECDGREKLILLGEGRLLDDAPKKPAAKAG